MNEFLEKISGMTGVEGFAAGAFVALASVARHWLTGRRGSEKDAYDYAREQSDKVEQVYDRYENLLEKCARLQGELTASEIEAHRLRGEIDEIREEVESASNAGLDDVDTDEFR